MEYSTYFFFSLISKNYNNFLMIDLRLISANMMISKPGIIEKSEIKIESLHCYKHFLDYLYKVELSICIK